MYKYIGCFLLFCFFASSVMAEVGIASTPVAERQYEAFQPKGLKLGIFKVLPKIMAQTAYNSNVYITETNEQSDLVNSLKPSLKVSSDWNNHSMSLDVEGELKRFVDNDSEDQNNLRVSYLRSLHVRRALDLYGKSFFAYDHEDRDEILDTQSPASPFRYKDLNLALGARYKPGRHVFEAEVGQRYLRFEDEQSFVAPAIRSVRSDADRDETHLRLNHQYALHDDLKTEMRLSYRMLNYQRLSYQTGPMSFTGFNQDADVAGAKIGLSGNLFRDVHGHVLVGAERQTFDDPGLKDVTGSSVDIGLNWNPSSIGTISLGYNRHLETDNAVEGGLIRQNFSLGYDHELRRNIVLGGRIEYEMRDFENVAREDETFRYGLTARYLFNDKYSLNFGADYDVRDSNIVGQDYDQFIFMLGLSREF